MSRQRRRPLMSQSRRRLRSRRRLKSRTALERREFRRLSAVLAPTRPLPVSVSPLDRFHLHALVLAGFRILKVRIDAALIRVKRVLVLSARIKLWCIGLCRAAAARKRKRAKRDNHPRHWPRSIGEAVLGPA